MTDTLLVGNGVSSEYPHVVKKLKSEIDMSDEDQSEDVGGSGIGTSFGDDRDVGSIEPSIANHQHHQPDQDDVLHGNKEGDDDLVRHVVAEDTHGDGPSENEDPLLVVDKGDINEAIIKSLLLTVHQSYMEAAGAGVVGGHSPHSPHSAHSTPKERNSHLDAYNAAHKPIANMFIPGHVLTKNNCRTKLTTDDIQLILFLIVQVKPFKYVGDRSLSQTKKWLIIQDRFEQIKKKQFGTNKRVLVPTVRTLQRQLASAVARGQERVSPSMSVSYIVNQTAKIIKELDRYSSLSEMEFVLAALNLLSDKIKHGEYSNAPVEFSMVQPYNGHSDSHISLLKSSSVPPSLLSSRIPPLLQYAKEAGREASSSSNGLATSPQIPNLDAAAVLSSSAVEDTMGTVESSREIPVELVSPELHDSNAPGVDEISLTKTLSALSSCRSAAEELVLKLMESGEDQEDFAKAVPAIKDVLTFLQKFRDLHKREVDRIEREAERAIEAAREKRDLLLLATKQTRLNQVQVNEQFVRKLLDLIPVSEQAKNPELVATLDAITSVSQQ